MKLRFHNTLTKQKDDFTPLADGKVNMFVCGPTVYDFSHMGHAKTYIQFDLLARVIRAAGYELFYLQNITDIDDKIIERARDRSIDWQDLSRQFEAEYRQDITALNITSVDEYARATDYIANIIAQVQTLIDKGHAYEIPGDGIYFEISTFPAYGKLSGRTELKENDAQTRIDQSDNKRGWNDFALWKFAKEGDPVWPAPFGDGRPGWHIEDTAITEHFFGAQYDLHGGAIDLIFPHHEAEVTQMESASGKVPFVGYWMHTGFLTINGEKMSKSLGNFYTIREVLEKGYDPMAVRLLMLQTHYRSPINFTFENLDAATNRLRHWRSIAALRHQTHDQLRDDDDKANDEQSVSPYAASQAILEALADDLNTPEAFRLIEDVFTRLAATPKERIHRHALVELLDRLDAILGLALLEKTPDITDEVKQLILSRERAREQRDWAASDSLRETIEQSGITIRDTPAGTIWEYQ
jgi:cysteinyl-tRNA synthetase